MILSTTEDLQKYISVSQSFEFETFVPYISKAINSYTNKYVGDLHIFLGDEATGVDAEIINQAREHLRSAIANFGYFLFTPYNSILMDSSGMANIQNEHRKNIEWWQLNDIRRDLLRSGHESMDLLLTILEQNPTLFPNYTANFGTQNTELLVHSTPEFQKFFNIFDSRQTFLALIPSIRQVEDQYIKTLLSKELIDALKTTSNNDNVNLVKEYCQKAIISFTISKVYDEGIFAVDSGSLKLKIDILPNEKSSALDMTRASEQTIRAIKKNIENGTNYLLMVKDTIKNNPTDFTAFTNPLKQPIPATYTVYNKSGVVGI